MLAAELEKELFEFAAEPFVESSERGIAAAIIRQGLRGAVFGASGGVDSLVTAALCLRAGGRIDEYPVVGLQMNDSRIKGEHYNPKMYQDLGVELVQVDITDEAIATEKRLGLPPHWLPISLMKLLFKWMPIRLSQKVMLNLMAGEAPEWMLSHYRLLTLPHRLRISRLKEYASRHSLMLVTCANRTEASLGYFVEQGVDDPQMGDYTPILNLYKLQVIRTAQFLDLPERIISQRPSPGFGGIHDEEILGPYGLVDIILAALHRGYPEAAIDQAIRQHAPALRKEGLLIEGPSLKRHVRFVKQLVELSARKRKKDVIDQTMKVPSDH